MGGNGHPDAKEVQVLEEEQARELLARRVRLLSVKNSDTGPPRNTREAFTLPCGGGGGKIHQPQAAWQSLWEERQEISC